MKISIFIVTLSFLWINACSKELNTEFGQGRVKFNQQKLSIDVEVAKTKQQREVGLMNRTQLAPDQGMLFVFDRNEIQRMWMKDTFIALDILFISSQGKIVSVHKALQPCHQSPCKIYHSIYNAVYMLEINAGIIERENIRAGQKLELYF
ncbi:MAG: DUF192 domain-containing protein [Methylococcales bacterium]|nr:DUF192 domain-containing protein [Methylococcales bacterium]